MGRSIKLLLLAVVLALTATTVAFGDTTVATVSWWTYSTGGRSSVTGITLDSSVGQPIVGVTKAPPREVCAGFLCGVIPNWLARLPVIRR